MKRTKKTTMNIIKEKAITLSGNQQVIVEKLDKIRNGRNACVVYRSDKEKYIKATFKNRYRVLKVSTFSIQKGVDYNNLKWVKEKRAKEIAETGTYKTKEAFYMKLDNNIGVNKKNPDILYLLAAGNTNKKAKGHSYYEVIDLMEPDLRKRTRRLTSKELQDKGIMIDSFWKPSNYNSDNDFRTLILDDVVDVH